MIVASSDNLPYEQIGKNEPVCIADEVPFEIPDSWEWVRASTLGYMVRGKGIKRTETVENGLPCVRYGEIYTSYNESFSMTKSFISARLDQSCNHFSKGDVVFTLTGENKVDIAKAIAYMGDIPVAAGGDMAYWTAHGMDPMYLVFFMTSPYCIEQKRRVATGDIIVHISTSKVGSFLVPVPPLEEQHRIVKKVSEIAPSLAEYNEKDVQVQELNSVFPEQLKKSILQWAVQGKLVPQDPSDEPASVLLERIREEKSQLIKEGKIKKDKNESIIYRRDNSHYEKDGEREICIDREMPFELPVGWEVIRLNDIGMYRKGPFGSSLTKSMFVPKGDNAIKVYEQKNAIQKDHTLGNYYITRDYYESKMQSFSVEPGDIIVSCAGTIGETYILPDDIEKGIINQALMRMTIYAPIDIDYFLLYFDYVLKQSARESSKGSAIKNIPPFAVFKKLLLPLPPLAEQKRIINKVKEIEALIDSI